MTKKELTRIAKEHGAGIITSGRSWGFYRVSADKIDSFSQIVNREKLTIHSNWSKTKNYFLVTVFLK